MSNIKEKLQEIRTLTKKRSKLSSKSKEYLRVNARIQHIRAQLKKKSSKPIKRIHKQPLLTGFFSAVDTVNISDIIFDKMISELSNGNEVAAEKYAKAYSTLQKVKKAQ